jgi:DNA-binding GntR family transcriptional regulator
VLEQRYGIHLREAAQTLEATVANSYEAMMFGVPAGAPMILLEGVTRDERSRPVEHYKAIYRGDRFKFAFASERGANAPLEAGVSPIRLVFS